MTMLDIEKAMAESGLPQDVLDEIVREAREDYHDDEMLFELRVIRSISAEIYERFGEEVWKKRHAERSQDFLDKHDLELVNEPLEVVQRVRRKPQAS